MIMLTHKFIYNCISKLNSICNKLVKTYDMKTEQKVQAHYEFVAALESAKQTSEVRFDNEMLEIGKLRTNLERKHKEVK